MNRRSVVNFDTVFRVGMTNGNHSITLAGTAALQNYQKISLASAIAYSIFGYIASVLSQGMKGPNGPMFAAVFIFALMAMDVVLIKGRFNLKQVNSVNLVSIVAFYFFSISLPLFLTCPSPFSPIIALLAFSMITFFAFSLIACLIRRVLVRAAN